MRWMQNSSRNCLRVSMICGWRSIRRASFFLSLLVGLWASSSSAVDDVSPSVDIDEAFLTNSLPLSFVKAVPSADQNTYDILTLLNLLTVLSHNVQSVRSMPVFDNNGTYVSLGKQIQESGFEGNNATRTGSFLFEIQRALYGQSGVPSSSQAILPVLWRVESALTNNQSCVDMGWTNLLLSSDGDSLLDSPWRVAEDIRWSGLSWYDVADFFTSAQGLPGTWGNLWDAFFLGETDLADVWEEDASEASSTDSALRVVDANVLSALLQLEQTAQGISYNVSAIANRGSQVVVISNLQELIRHIDQVTNYQATAADEYQAAQMDYETSDVESDGRAALSYQMDETQATMDSTVSTNYDFGSGSVQNPYNPIGSMISSFGQNLDSKLPDFNETGDEIIVLFDAQSDTPMDAAGVVRVNLRETMGSYVNTCGNVMSWFWRIVNAVFTILLVLRCMREVAGAI